MLIGGLLFSGMSLVEIFSVENLIKETRYRPYNEVSVPLVLFGLAVPFFIIIVAIKNGGSAVWISKGKLYGGFVKSVPINDLDFCNVRVHSSNFGRDLLIMNKALDFYECFNVTFALEDADLIIAKLKECSQFQDGFRPHNT
jgi:hypothetical protein